MTTAIHGRELSDSHITLYVVPPGILVVRWWTVLFFYVMRWKTYGLVCRWGVTIVSSGEQFSSASHPSLCSPTASAPDGFSTTVVQRNASGAKSDTDTRDRLLWPTEPWILKNCSTFGYKCTINMQAWVISMCIKKLFITMVKVIYCYFQIFKNHLPQQFAGSIHADCSLFSCSWSQCI